MTRFFKDTSVTQSLLSVQWLTAVSRSVLYSEKSEKRCLGLESTISDAHVQSLALAHSAQRVCPFPAEQPELLSHWCRPVTFTFGRDRTGQTACMNSRLYSHFHVHVSPCVMLKLLPGLKVFWSFRSRLITSRQCILKGVQNSYLSFRIYIPVVFP